jgi:DNA-binding PadR family transcriptional regulator
MAWEGGVSALEYHVLLALAADSLYGYAIREAVEAESGGAVTPRAGSLYRVISRLMSWGFVKEATPHGQTEPHPGRARRYYALTAEGRAALAAEAARLKGAAALAQKRLGMAGGGP